MSPAPVVRQTSWKAVIIQSIVLGGAITLLALLTELQFNQVILAVCLAYIAYAVGVREIVARHHRQGMRRVHAGDFAGAIPLFERSYEFFSRHLWLDRFRHLLLASSSSISYREMSLVNIAFCYGQIGDGTQCRAYYERALREFPGSAISSSALNLITASEKVS